LKQNGGWFTRTSRRFVYFQVMSGLERQPGHRGPATAARPDLTPLNLFTY